ncbi:MULTISPECIES: MFS transporter [Streptacidiphilus]|uniref:MFS transporter n=1 Tax=Streptacidiphilus cavernicola TaxID=3342716 RepID=A0ABV6UII1_9ACTN|nr:MFS transporter [Streptacidiphilus jeojiense]
MPKEQTSSAAKPPPPESIAPVPAPAAAAAPASSGSSGRLRRLARTALADVTPLRTSAHFRRLWFGQSVSSVGQQMTALAISVQVYALTGSPFATGLVGLCSLIPLVAFGLYGGAIADTMDRRKLGLYGASGLAVLSAALAGQAFLGVRQVWVLYLVVALQAVCFALNAPARASMVPRLVPAEQLPAANALSTVSMNLGLTVGPMLGGLLIGVWSYQAAYLVDAIAFSASLYAMWRLPSMRPQSSGSGGDGKADGARPRASVLDGLRFLKDRPNLRMSFMADLAAMVFGMPRALFPALALLLFHGDARTVGLLAAAPAVGALLGALFSGWVSRVHRHGLAVICAVLAWGLSIAGFGLARHLWLGLLLLAVAGASDTVSMIFRNTIMQAAAPDDMRGRLQGVFVVVVAGGPRLGDFESGTVAQLTSPTFSAVSGGLACVAVMLLLTARYPSFARYDSRHPTP